MHLPTKFLQNAMINFSPNKKSFILAHFIMYWLLKIIATRGKIFSLKFTKYRLAAVLRWDPLGS